MIASLSFLRPCSAVAVQACTQPLHRRSQVTSRPTLAWSSKPAFQHLKYCATFKVRPWPSSGDCILYIVYCRNMSWKDKLKGLKADFESMIHPRDQAQDQQPPPPPMASRPPPGPSPSFHTYWVPRFYPDTPVHVEWDAKLGNGPDGWGNQELEHYTAAPENSFQYDHLTSPLTSSSWTLVNHQG